MTDCLPCARHSAISLAQVECGNARHRDLILRKGIVDEVETPRTGVGQRLEHSLIEHAEDRGRAADAKCQNDYGKQGEAGLLPHLPEGEEQIEDHIGAKLFRGGCHRSRFYHCGGVRGLGGLTLSKRHKSGALGRTQSQEKAYLAADERR